jgi:hypothetical protein
MAVFAALVADAMSAPYRANSSQRRVAADRIPERAAAQPMLPEWCH